MVDMQKLLADVVAVVRNAGQILQHHYGTDIRCRVKQHAELVTDADTESEAILIEQLSQLMPNACILAEENGPIATDSRYCWVIDPLDGTTNFCHGLPHFCISVALTCDGVPQLAVVYQPLLNELFTAVVGGGAFFNGTPMRVSQVNELQKSILIFCDAYAKDRTFDWFAALEQELRSQTYTMRHLGAAALDMAYVAAGRVDGIFFGRLAWWDVAAGRLLIEEAGGRVTTNDGQMVTQGFESLIGANEHIHTALLAQITSFARIERP